MKKFIQEYNASSAETNSSTTKSSDIPSFTSDDW